MSISRILSISSLSTVLVASVGILTYFIYIQRKRGCRERRESSENPKSYEDLIGNTPILRLSKLSKIVGCNIFVKMESMNPSGTGKDRAAKWMLEDMLAKSSSIGTKHVVEGTSGSTGIALAHICNSKGLSLHIVMPDDQSKEKRDILERLGASVTVVPCCSIANEQNYVNVAKKLAVDIGGIFIDQFENTANYFAHLEETGPEIWTQLSGNIDAFVMSAGTGGTIAGVSQYLKMKNPNVKIVLADPEGSSLYHRVKYGVCFTRQQTERKTKKHRYDTVVEGVGLDRITANFAAACIDDGEKVSDQDILDMAHWLLKNEGLFVGSSSALNIVAACKAAKRLSLRPDQTVVTIVCDSGHRHVSRFWNPEFIALSQASGKYDVSWPVADVVPACLK